MMLEELYLSTRMKDDILLCPVSQSVAREQTVVDPRYCLHSHPLSWDWQTQDNNRETPHVNTYLFLFSCSGLWSRREIIYRLLFFMRICAVPTPSVAGKLNKIICLRLADWLSGIWVCLWRWLKFNLMRGTLPPYPPTTALLTLLLICSQFLTLILPCLPCAFIGLSIFIGRR